MMFGVELQNIVKCFKKKLVLIMFNSMILRFKFLLIFFLLLTKNAISQSQPWVEENAIWKYRFQDQSLGGQWGLIKVYKTGNAIYGGHLCDELITKKYTYTTSEPWEILDSIIVDTNYTYLSDSGDSVLYYQNGVFRVLYDFSANVGDSLLIHVTSEPGNFNCDDSSYAFITSNSIINISGNDYRIQTVGKSSSWNDKYTLGSYPIGLGYGINERFGAVQYDIDGYLFPVHETNCFPENLLFRFLCFSDNNLTYDVDCDYFETLGIDNVFQTNVSVYPNPTQENLQIKGVDENSTIYITDVYGQIVQTINKHELPILNISHLQKGVYWLLISDSSLKLTNLKIVKL